VSRSPYADPALYDLLHDDGTDDEVWLLDRLAGLHGVPEKSAFEPACGTGRYLEGLLRRGWRVEGQDLSPKMAAYARGRLARWKERARVGVGDMRRDGPKARVGLAFNLLSTFRHLMTERDARAHLRTAARALLPGGLFVLGLDLADYAETEADEETWTIRRGGRTWRQVQMTFPARRRERRETVLNFVTGPDGRVTKTEHALRAYDARELKALLARSPFRVEAAYGYDGRPARLGGPERALWLLLRARA
jgi:SAM-dependent methyltransferase